MIKIDVENILASLFNIASKEDSNISLISILTIKSLLPSSQGKGNRIDYKRFNEELKLWKLYRVGDNQTILNILGDIDREIYFNSKDRTIYSRILPIIVGNENYDFIEDELVKNILFTSGNLEILLEWLLIGKFLYLLIKKEEDLIEKLKDYIINISQVDFLNSYKDFYRIGLEGRLKNYKIKFERTRLDLINILNGVFQGRYKDVEDIIRIYKGERPDSLFGEILYNSIEGKEVDYKLNNFYKNMNNYILRLRKGRINPKNLIIKEYILPDVFQYEEGDVFFHSLLNESKVIKKEVKGGVLTSLIRAKSGMYLFKEDLV